MLLVGSCGSAEVDGSLDGVKGALRSRGLWLTGELESRWPGRLGGESSESSTGGLPSICGD